MDSTSSTREKANKKKQQHAADPVDHTQDTEEGTSWQFYVVLAVVGIGILGLIAKTIGLF